MLLLGGGITCGVLLISIPVTMVTGYSNVWAGIIVTIIFALVYFISPRSYLLLILPLLSMFELDIFITRSSLFFLGLKTFNIISLIYLELIFFGVLYFITNKRVHLQRLSFFLPLLLFSIFITLNLVFLSPDQWSGLRQWLRLMGWISLFFMVAVHVQERNDIRKFINIAAIGLVLPLLGAIWSLVTGQRTGLWLARDYGVYEIQGWYPPAHTLAKILFALFPYVIFLALVSNTRKVLYLILGGCVFVAIFYTYARTAWVGLFVFFAAFLILGIIRRKKKYIYLTLFSLVLASILFSVNIESVVQRNPDFLSPGFLKGSFVTKYLFNEPAVLKKPAAFNGWYGGRRYAKSISEMGSGRVGVWETLLKNWSNASLKDKLLGQGIYSVPGILNEGYGAHNDYIDLLVETGLLGLTLYLWFLIVVFKRLLLFLRKSMDEYYKSLACCSIALFFSFIFMSMFEAHIYAQSSQLYIVGFIGIAIGASENLASKRKPQA